MIKNGSKVGVSDLEVRKAACTEPIKILEGAFIQTLGQLGFKIQDMYSDENLPLHVFVDKL